MVYVLLSTLLSKGKSNYRIREEVLSRCFFKQCSNSKSSILCTATTSSIEVERISDRLIANEKKLSEFDLLICIAGIGEISAALVNLVTILAFRIIKKVNAFIGIDIRRYQSVKYKDKITSINGEIQKEGKSYI
jgi:hypothetical protein